MWNFFFFFNFFVSHLFFLFLPTIKRNLKKLSGQNFSTFWHMKKIKWTNVAKTFSLASQGFRTSLVRRKPGEERRRALKQVDISLQAMTEPASKL